MRPEDERRPTSAASRCRAWRRDVDGAFRDRPRRSGDALLPGGADPSRRPCLGRDRLQRLCHGAGLGRRRDRGVAGCSGRARSGDRAGGLDRGVARERRASVAGAEDGGDRAARSRSCARSPQLPDRDRQLRQLPPRACRRRRPSRRRRAPRDRRPRRRPRRPAAGIRPAAGHRHPGAPRRRRGDPRAPAT